MRLNTVQAMAVLMLTSGLASAQTGPAPATSVANFDGEWSGSGGVRLVLKTDPTGLTGTLMEPAGAGPITIERGSVNGRTATFVTSRSVNGEPVTMTWTAELNDDDTLAVSRLMDSSRAGRGGREGRGPAAGAARGQGERGAGPRAGGAGRGEGRAGRGREGGGASPEAEPANPTEPAVGRAGRAGAEGRGTGGERGRAGGGERGRAGGGRGGRAGGPAARGAGDPGGGFGAFPAILRRVP